MIIINADYLLNFVIPQGPTGPTGPQGVTGPTGPTGSFEGLDAYGGRYNNSAPVINLTIGSSSVIPLDVNMPSKSVNYGTNTISITESGVYEINYYANMSAAVATTVTMAVRNNGTNIPSTSISRALSVGVSSVYSGSTIVNLNSGAVLDLSLSALLAVGVTLGTGVGASLTVKKLN